MSLCGPTVLAFDQLDPIVTELSFRTEGASAIGRAGQAKSIIAQIGGGLGSLRDVTCKTFVVISCVEGMEKLGETILRQSIDRFEAPHKLQSVNNRDDRRGHRQ